MHGATVKLRGLLGAHFWHWVAFTAVNGVTFALGVIIFYVEVTHLDQNKYVMHWANVPLMTALTFAFNSQLPWWRKRKSSSTSGLMCWSKFSAAKSLTSQGMFLVLVGLAGLPYLWVSSLITISIGFISYIINEVGVFPQRNRTTTLA